MGRARGPGGGRLGRRAYAAAAGAAARTAAAAAASAAPAAGPTRAAARAAAAAKAAAAALLLSLLLLGAPRAAAADTGAVAAAVGTAVARAIHGGGPLRATVGVPEWDGLAVSVSDAFSDIVLMDSPLADLVPAGAVRNAGRAAGRAAEAAERAGALRSGAAERAGALRSRALAAVRGGQRQGQGQPPEQVPAPTKAGNSARALGQRPAPARRASSPPAAAAPAARVAAAKGADVRPAATSPTGYGLYGRLEALSSASGALVAPPPGVQVACFAAGPGPAAAGEGPQVCSAVADAADGRFACKIPPGPLAKAARAGMLDPLHCAAKSASGYIRGFVSAPFSAAINGSGAPLTAASADPRLWALPRSAGTMLPGGWRVAPVRRCGATASPAGRCNALARLGRLAAGDDPVLLAAATGAVPAVPALATAAKGKDDSGGVIGWAIKMAGFGGSAGGKGGAPSSSSSSSSSLSLLAAATPPAAARPAASGSWLEASFDGLCAAHACCTRDALAATLSGAGSTAAAAFSRRAACDAELRDALASLCRGPRALVAAGQEVCAGVAEDVAAAAAQATVVAGKAARVAEKAAKEAAGEARRLAEQKRAAAAAAAAAEAEAAAASAAAASAAASAKKKRGFFG